MKIIERPHPWRLHVPVSPRFLFPRQCCPPLRRHPRRRRPGMGGGDGLRSAVPRQSAEGSQNPHAGLRLHRVRGGRGGRSRLQARLRGAVPAVPRRTAHQSLDAVHGQALRRNPGRRRHSWCRRRTGQRLQLGVRRSLYGRDRRGYAPSRWRRMENRHPRTRKRHPLREDVVRGEDEAHSERWPDADRKLPGPRSGRLLRDRRTETSVVPRVPRNESLALRCGVSLFLSTDE